MDFLYRIITEEINKAILSNYQKKIVKLLGDLSKIDFSPYGNEIMEYAQDLSNLGYNVVSYMKGENVNQANNMPNKRGRFSFNGNWLSNGLSKYGIKMPDEGITNNVVGNARKWYNTTQNIWGVKNAQNTNNEQEIQNNIKQFMDSYWPQLFTRYSNIVGRYSAVLSRIPTLTMLTQTLEQLYDAIK